MSEHENPRLQMDAIQRLQESTELACKLFFQDGKEVNDILKHLGVERYTLEMTIRQIGKDLIREDRGVIRVRPDAIAYESRLLHLRKQDLASKYPFRPNHRTTSSGFMSDADAVRWILKDRGEE